MANATKDRSVNVRARRITARIERLKVELSKLKAEPQQQAKQATTQPEKKSSWVSGLLGIPRRIFGSVSNATRVTVKTVTTGARKVVKTVKSGAHKAATVTVKNAGAIKASLVKVNKLVAKAISHVSERVGAFWDKYSVPVLAVALAVIGVGFAFGGGALGAFLALFYISLATTIALTWAVNAVLDHNRAIIVYRPSTT